MSIATTKRPLNEFEHIVYDEILRQFDSLTPSEAATFVYLEKTGKASCLLKALCVAQDAVSIETIADNYIRVVKVVASRTKWGDE